MNWRPVQTTRIAWGDYLNKITRNAWWGSLTEQVRKDLGTPVVIPNYHGRGKHLWGELPNIWVQTEDGQNVVVHPSAVERKHKHGGIGHYISLDGPMGSYYEVRVTKWKVATP